MDSNEFQKDKAIDPTQLDVECVRQADRFFVWSERLAKADAAVDHTKFTLEVVEAQLEIECRKDPGSFGLAKSTESGIKAAVKLHSKYEMARSAFIESRKEAKLLGAAVNAMEQKKRMLECLITLHGQSYFAGPSVPRDLTGAWKKYCDATEKNVNARQAQRTRKRGE